MKCELCPIEKNRSAWKEKQSLIFFDIGCGADETCHSNLSLKAFFYDFENLLTSWTIGSDEEVVLEVVLENHNEPAYLTTLNVEVPSSVSLRSLLPNCRENNDDADLLRVACDIDNPLIKGVQKSTVFDLDMGGLNENYSNDSEISFNIFVTTQSINNGINNFTASLQLQRNISLSLNGKSNEKNYYLSFEDESFSPNVSFQHVYQVIKNGITPAKLTRLTINIPYSINSLEFLSLTNKPEIFISGKLYKCFVTDVSIFQKHYSNTFYTPSILKEDTFQQFKNKNLSTSNDDTDLTSNFSFLTMNDNEFENDEIYLNCSSSNVKCGRIICNMDSLKTDYHTGNLQIKFLINTSLLMNEIARDKETIIFESEASIQMFSPMGLNSSVSSFEDSFKITTLFFKVKQLKRINILIVSSSIVLGLFVLLIIAVILRKCGFFQRNKKDKLDELKSNNSSSNVDALQLEESQKIKTN